ncbi:MAG TPA: HNH endonuclease [Puia sp.]
MRNPKWHRDEIILALDLYFSPTRGSLDAKNPNIIELSKILNSLPLFYNKPDEEKFRNPNGVTLKLSNFLPFDPNYTGKGMTSGSKLDKEIFYEFQNKKDELRSIASEIRKVVADEDLKRKIYTIEEDEVTQDDAVVEGQVLYKLHKFRERNKEIVKRKKDQAILLHGKLTCEACIFVFEEFYGGIGKGFIECHHLTPLSKFKVETKTTLDDLGLVCSNCHRMLHKKIDTLSLQDLKTMIKYHRH